MPTLLVVDDHDDIREMMTLQLQRRGFSVVAARNGIEAVLAAANAAPALILMDVNMPELDGFEATMQIHQANAENRIPVIALTAYALPGDQARAIAAGCDAFHPKPVDFEKLIEQINGLIEATSTL
ncbi:CheY-like chemotaxis protein [Rhodopirellula rubra]|uniref:CheY-like chemotaxis protein n=1 Tax=Aporhodopirellula rubra TaxID=980271 RepID=A0A7W5DZ18_9BACT|nr:response regulator [Aporhodopirellula rubra]MBB3206802.1 CheY-like chemotaxis protein [Aporhodopirellula rubra]